VTYPAGGIIYAADHEAEVSAWASFVPVWTASTVNPVLGNGTITGRWKRHGYSVDFKIGVTMGSTTTFGTGSWFFSIPVPAYQPGHPLNEIYVGEWRGWDNSVPAGRQGTVMLAAASTIHPHTVADPAANVLSTVPITWATADRFTIAGRYEAA
jgi:hypothetical protein